MERDVSGFRDGEKHLSQDSRFASSAEDSLPLVFVSSVKLSRGNSATIS